MDQSGLPAAGGVFDRRQDFKLMLKGRRIAALIPARGGSKGIDRKNIRSFLDKPLLVHSIEYAKSCRLVDEIFVSTEDTEIGGIAEQSGARVIWRPMDLADDTATTESAIKHALAEMLHRGLGCDVVALLQATSPLRPEHSLKQALKDFVEGGFDSMLSITPIHPFFWRVKGEKAVAEYNYLQRPQRQNMKREDIRYLENGSVYIFTSRHFQEVGNRLGGKIGYTLFDKEYSHDIDSWDDFRFVEQIARRIQED